eukprot:664312-Amphidinium_carterae.1
MCIQWTIGILQEWRGRPSRPAELAARCPTRHTLAARTLCADTAKRRPDFQVSTQEEDFGRDESRAQKKFGFFDLCEEGGSFQLRLSST